MNLVREKSVKSQRISFQTKSGHPVLEKTFQKKNKKNPIRVTNSMDPDPARHFNRSKLFANVISRQQES